MRARVVLRMASVHGSIPHFASMMQHRFAQLSGQFVSTFNVQSTRTAEAEVRNGIVRPTHRPPPRMKKFDGSTLRVLRALDVIPVYVVFADALGCCNAFCLGRRWISSAVWLVLVRCVRNAIAIIRVVTVLVLVESGLHAVVSKTPRSTIDRNRSCRCLPARRLVLAFFAQLHYEKETSATALRKMAG